MHQTNGPALEGYIIENAEQEEIGDIGVMDQAEQIY